jgi:YVTN family beta-propeller protein
MRKLKLMVAILSGSAMLLTSCLKDETSTNPDGIAGNFDAAYVVNGESKSISVINLSTNQVDKTIDLVKLISSSAGTAMGTDMNMDNMWAHHISLSSDKSKIIIAAPGGLSDSEHMMQSTATTGTTTDTHSQHHAGSSTTSSPADNMMQGGILILDAVSGELLQKIALDGMVHNAVFSPDGKELWTVIMMTEGNVKVFDTSNYSLLSTITVDQMSGELTFSADGKKVFVADEMSDTITVIDAATRKILERKADANSVGTWSGMDGMMHVDTGVDLGMSSVTNMMDMMNDTLKLGFVPGMAARNAMMNQMWVSDPKGGKIHYWTVNDSKLTHGGTFEVGKGAHAIAFSKDGKVGYVTNEDDASVSVVDVAGKKEILKIKVGDKPHGIVIRNK